MTDLENQLAELTARVDGLAETLSTVVETQRKLALIVDALVDNRPQRPAVEDVMLRIMTQPVRPHRRRWFR